MADVGYTASDPLAGVEYGYRSNSARQPSTFFAQDAEISYNGFVFPPVTNSKATIVQEYTKDGRSVKYLTIAITVEAFITQYDKASPDGTTGGYTIDRHMDEIRKRLSQPCQILSFNFQGLGNIQINGSRNTTAGTPIYDVDYGPKPQVLDWQPLGGSLGARIEWLVTTRIPPCTASNTGLSGIIDFGYEVNWSIGDPGWLTRTVKGYVELAATRRSNTSADSIANQLVDLTQNIELFNKAVQRIENLFTPLPGFLRDPVTYAVSPNKKALVYSITDTQIQSQNPYFNGAIEVELEESLESSMDGGAAFSVWNWGFSGSVKVANTAGLTTNITDNKRLCFSAFGLAIKDRLDRIRLNPLNYTHEFPSSQTPISPAHNAVFIPNRFRVSNQCYGTEINVQADFTLYCPGQLVVIASGMFDDIRIYGYTWQSWREFLNQHGIKAPIEGILPKQDIIVDLCHPLTETSKETVFREEQRGFGRIPTPDAFIIPPEAETWLDYRNTFYFLNRNFTVVGTVGSERAREIVERPSQNPKQENELDISIKSPSGTVGDTARYASRVFEPDLQTGAEPIGYVTMIGSAVRIGYAINAPKLLYVGGVPCVKTGDDVTIQQSAPSGFHRTLGNLSQGTVNIYRLGWRRTYALTREPANWNPTTDGLPQIYI